MRPRVLEPVRRRSTVKQDVRALEFLSREKAKTGQISDLPSRRHTQFAIDNAMENRYRRARINYRSEQQANRKEGVKRSGLWRAVLRLLGRK